MPTIKYILQDGSEHQVNVETGSSVMQGALDNMIEGIEAECGGFCSCATCHCYVDEPWLDKLSEPSDAEKEMLEFTFDPMPNSRLSCQITVTDELDGLIVRLPEEQS
jgi:2Fe-2S ferredoxin